MKSIIGSGAVLGVVALIACSGQGSGTGSAQQAVDTDGGLGSDSGADSGGDSGTGTGTCGNPSFGVCSDAQVAAIVHVSNQGEIQLAQALRSKFQDSGVRAFADQMIADHTALDSALMATGLVGSGASDNGLVKELQESAQLELTHLQSMSGADLDRSYIDHEVLDHIKDLGLGEMVLVPSAKDARLVAILGQARTAITTHAQLAIPIQTRLEGACGGPQGGTSGSDGGTSGTDAGTSSGSDAGSGGTGSSSSGGTSGSDGGSTSGSDAGTSGSGTPMW